MKKPTATLIVTLIFAVIALVGFVWTLLGGAADGSKLVMYWFGALAIIAAVLSRIFGKAWFTDSAGGR